MWNEVVKILMEGLSLAAQHILEGVLAVLAGWLVSWIAKYVKLTILESIANLAVNAAEQLGVNKEIEDKFAYAKEVVENHLAKIGLKIDVDTINAAIEAKVMENFNKAKNSGKLVELTAPVFKTPTE